MRITPLLYKLNRIFFFRLKEESIKFFLYTAKFLNTLERLSHSGQFWLEQADIWFYSQSLSARVIIKTISYRLSGALFLMVKSKSIFKNFGFSGF